MSSTTRPCPICSHPEPAAVYRNDMAAIGGFDMSYTVARCIGCGFFFASSLADDATFEGYYKSLSKYDVATTLSRVDRLRTDAAVRLCEGRVPHDARILDLGCGFGALLGRFKAGGWSQLHGIDPAPRSAECAKEMFGLDHIYCGTMRQAPGLFPMESADLVCIMAVLEHLPHLRSDIADLLQHLKPGCRILVEVPALERFSGEDGEPFGEFSLEHIQYFSASSLTNFFGALGATPMHLEWVDLSPGNADSLLGLFELAPHNATHLPIRPEPHDVMQRYIDDCTRRFDEALRRIPAGPLIIYGAGSHTSRLLPQLARRPGKTVVAVVDNNPNLTNKSIGEWVIQTPACIEATPEIPILISSFRFQQEISSNLHQRYPNPQILMYG